MAVALLISMVNPVSFGIIYRLTLAYLLMYLAVVARPFRFSPRGDYSYGIYIYAFPIQQTLVTTISGITSLQLTLSSFAITFAFAFASWHGIEKYALRMKERLVKRIPRVFAPGQQP
jgi:peptidoglycan/LPS O-acetylase OafA/YrhL